MRKNQSGNALFLILIAVALFAALSYAVTQSGRGGGNIDRENTEIAASQITQYAELISQSVLRLRLINGCTESELNFNFDSDGDGNVNNDAGDSYNNPNSPTDLSCHVFHPNGGGVPFQDLSQFSPTTGPQGILIVGTTSVEDIGTPAPELMLVSVITPELCDVINRNLGIDPDNVDDNIASGSGTLFTGTFTSVAVNGDDGGATSLPPGLARFCMRRIPNDTFSYRHILIER